MGGNGPEQNTELKIDKKTFKGFDNTIETKAQIFLDALKNAKKTKQEGKINTYKEAFTSTGKETLQAIGDHMMLNFHSIDNTNKKAPKLQTYIDAKAAFQEDISKLNIYDTDFNTMLSGLQDIIDLKQIDTQDFGQDRLETLKTLATEMNKKELLISGENKLNTMNDITTKIKKKIEEKQKEINQKNLSTTINILNTNYTSQEQVKKNIFEGNKSGFDAIMKTLYVDSTEAKEITDKDPQEKRLIEYIKLYTGNNNIKNINIGKGKNFADDRFNQSDERIIQYQDNNETRYLARGTWKDLYTIPADKNIPANTDETGEKTFDIENFKKIDRTSTEKGINAFDNKGNFVAFGRFIEAKGSGYVKENFNSIITHILEYKPTENGIDDKDHKNNNYVELKNGYANVLTQYMINTSDIGLLTIYLSYVKKDNLNILGADSTTRINNYNTLFFSDISKKQLRPNIEQYLQTLGDEEKKQCMNQIAEVNNAINTNKKMTIKESFDNMIDAFGPILFTVLSLFGVSKATLLQRFPDAKDTINEKFKQEYGLSTEQLDTLKNTTKDNYQKTPIADKGDLTRGENIQKAFEKKTSTYENTIIQYPKHININIFKTGVDKYNKKQNKNININDIITTTITDKKEQISSIKDETIFKNIINTIIEDPKTRERIATANKDIQTPATYEKQKLKINKQGLDETESRRYLIESEQDIARYLTASLFSDKDLAYVMTESNLHNQITIEKPKKTKEIHKGKVQIKGKDTDTYVYSDNTRVKIYDGDKIEIVETPQQRYQENDKKIETGLKTITTSEPKKYKDFAFQNFTYNKDATDSQKNYQNELLTPIKDILQDKEQFALLCKDSNFSTKAKNIGPTHIKNTFLMMDAENTQKKYEKLTNNIKDWTSITASTNDGIGITQDTGTITIKYDNDTLTSERKEKQKTS